MAGVGASGFRAVVLAGDGVVARFPGLVCVARCPDPAPVARLLEVCAAAAGDEPGRVLARRLAAWLAGVDAPPADLLFGTIAAAGASRAVFLSGEVEARLGDLHLSGADSAAWLDRLVPAGTGAARLVLPGVADGPPPALLDLRDGVVAGAGVELVAGERITADPVVQERAAVPAERAPRPAPDPSRRPGNALPTLVDVEPVSVEDAAPAGVDAPGEPDPVPTPPVGVPAAERAAPDQARPEPAPVAQDRGGAGPDGDGPDAVGPDAVGPDAVGQDAVGPDAVGTGPIAAARPSLRAPQRAEAILGVAPAEPARAPLEAGDAVGTGERSVRPAAATGPAAGEARGHLCSRGHLNDPRSHFCVLCGIRMNERTGVLVVGQRPPLGLLVFDDGATYTVDAEYLVGRMPESDERVRSGALRAIVVEDRSGAVSRVHAEIRVDGWDVVLVDSGSRNGTHVAGPGEPAWSPLPARHTHRLVPGTRVRMGARTFVFESPSGVR